MAKAKKAKRLGPKTSAEKLNEIIPGALEDIMSSNTDSLKNRLVTLELQDKEIEEAKKGDTDLQSRKAAYDIARETYSEPLKVNRLKRRVIAQVLEERGKASSSEVVK